MKKVPAESNGAILSLSVRGDGIVVPGGSPQYRGLATWS